MTNETLNHQETMSHHVLEQHPQWKRLLHLHKTQHGLVPPKAYTFYDMKRNEKIESQDVLTLLYLGSERLGRRTVDGHRQETVLTVMDSRYVVCLLPRPTKKQSTAVAWQKYNIHEKQ
jgi:hypothetical protein